MSHVRRGDDVAEVRCPRCNNVVAFIVEPQMTALNSPAELWTTDVIPRSVMCYPAFGKKGCGAKLIPTGGTET